MTALPATRSVTLGERAGGRANNFDVLRLLAATLVLLSHCFPLTGHDEPFGALTGWTLGEVGVVMFFAMSGFLIAKSWSEQPQLLPFAAKRALRLLPALIVAVLVTALVLGPLFTTRSVGDYFTAPGTWAYIARNSLLYTVSGRLPGVFTENVYPAAVNGSLWTLPVESAAYAMAACLGLLGLLRRSGPLLVACAAVLLCTTPLLSLGSDVGGGTAGGNVTIVLKLVAAFLFGSAMYATRDRLRLSWLLLAGLGALWVLTWGSGWVKPTGVVAIGFGVLVCAYRTPVGLRRVTRPGDVSYGIYVYAFPVQQALSALWGRSLHPLVMFAIAFPVTYALAFASWRVVEHPALRLKRRLA